MQVIVVMVVYRRISDPVDPFSANKLKYGQNIIHVALLVYYTEMKSNANELLQGE